MWFLCSSVFLFLSIWQPRAFAFLLRRDPISLSPHRRRQLPRIPFSSEFEEGDRVESLPRTVLKATHRTGIAVPEDVRLFGLSALNHQETDEAYAYAWQTEMQVWMPGIFPDEIEWKFIAWPGRKGPMFYVNFPKNSIVKRWEYDNFTGLRKRLNAVGVQKGFARMQRAYCFSNDAVIEKAVCVLSGGVFKLLVPYKVDHENDLKQLEADGGLVPPLYTPDDDEDPEEKYEIAKQENIDVYKKEADELCAAREKEIEDDWQDMVEKTQFLKPPTDLPPINMETEVNKERYAKMRAEQLEEERQAIELARAKAAAYAKMKEEEAEKKREEERKRAEERAAKKKEAEVQAAEAAAAEAEGGEEGEEAAEAPEGEP
mmetsp:Transcript_47258/g.93250  ORF Transcript_47258/g.93250 Transcript_47258/m.93250 type:complete len:373 (+) Transcript_47258:230-1348(+)